MYMYKIDYFTVGRYMYVIYNRAFFTTLHKIHKGQAVHNYLHVHSVVD